MRDASLPPLDWDAQFSFNATRTSQQNAENRMGAASKQTDSKRECASDNSMPSKT